MWAGGRLTFFRDIGIGTTLRRESRISQTADREGRSGRLRFVTLRHSISADSGKVIEEEQDLVYRAPHGLHHDAPPAPAAPPWACIRSIVPDEILLFRFSALTFNAHRVHYDLAYARDVEHYPGLLVHGPLQAILLADHLGTVSPAGAIRQFDYRSQAPAFANRKLHLEAWPDAESQSTWHLQTRDPSGAICMKAKARIEHDAVAQDLHHD
jgi:3-methylfumaryl-CoA hydratase